MENLFQSSVADNILSRIEKLQPGMQPLWGKMNVSQMLAHCKVPLEVAVGEKELKRTLMGVIFGRIGKKQMLKAEPFKKNLPTDPRFVVKNNPDFTSEKHKLESLIRRFAASDPKCHCTSATSFLWKDDSRRMGLASIQTSRSSFATIWSVDFFW